MHKDIEFLFQTLRIQTATLRDICHSTTKNHVDEMGPLNLVWSALDLLDMTVDRAEKEIVDKALNREI